VSRDVAVLLGLVVVSATWVFAHGLLLLRVLRMAGVPGWQRALALLPIVTPVVALRAGARMLPALWFSCGAGYLLLRLLG